MDRLANNSILSLDRLYDYYPALDNFSINRYQITTVFWNIFLLALPLAAWLMLRKLWRQSSLVSPGQKIAAGALFLFWLLFFPNTAYIITDIRHLLNYCPPDSPERVCKENAWMIMFFFTYASLGWLSFYYYLSSMADLLKAMIAGFKRRLFIIGIIPLAALGVLLGLLNRFNSWDILFYPSELGRSLILYFTQADYAIDWAVFSVFLYLLFFLGDAIFRKIKI